MQSNELRRAVPDRWRAWRQRLRGDPEYLPSVFAFLALPSNRTPDSVSRRIDRAAALCDAALFMMWLARIASPSAGEKRLLGKPSGDYDLRPSDIVSFVATLTANGVIDQDFNSAENTAEDADFVAPIQAD